MKHLHYLQTGQGPDVILIHGLFGSLENLGTVSKALNSNYKVTCIDVRNHGQSPHESTMTYEELALDVIKLMDHLSINNAHILGHSMGGKIAMQVAVQHSHRVNKLMIADIAPIEYPAHHAKIIEGLQSIDFSQVNNRKDVDKQLSHYVEEAGIRQFLLKNITQVDGKLCFKCHVGNIANCYIQIMSGMNTSQQFLGEVLFIKGGHSNYIMPEHQTSIKSIFPNSKAKIIQGAGHWLHAEKPIAFNKIINDFLGDN